MEQNPFLNLTKGKKEKFIKEIRQEKRNDLLQKKRELYVEKNHKEKILYESDIEEDEDMDKSKKSEEIDLTLDKLYLEISDKNADLEEKEATVMALKKHIETAENKSDVIQKFIDKNFIIILIDMLNNKDIEGDSEQNILKILGTMASGNTYQCNSLIEKGGVEIFLKALAKADENHEKPTLEIIFWTLGNISGDNIKSRNLLLRLNVFDITIKFLETNITSQYHYRSALRHAVWLLANLCREKPPENFQITYQAFPVFAMTVDKVFDDIHVFVDASYAMKQLALIYLKANDLSEENCKIVKFFINCELFNVMNNLLRTKDRDVMLNCLTLFIKILKTNVPVAKELTKNMNFFQNISRLLKAEVRDIRRKFLKLMNIATPMNPGLIDIIYTNKIHEDLLPICLKDDISVQKEAYELISIILIHSSQEQFEIMFKLDLMEIFYWGLYNKEHSFLIVSSLNSLFFLLNFAKNHLSTTYNDSNIIAEQMIKNGILNLIDKLQLHSNKDVYERSLVIIETFFTIEEEFIT